MRDQTKDYLQRLAKVLESLNAEDIDSLKGKIAKMIGSEKTLFVCGNGGSAATASHMACDLGKTILGKKPRANLKRLRVISLNDSIPMLTAWGNDEGYEFIFSQQLKNLGGKGDFLIIITGSGNSKNILEVIKEAKRMKIKTFGLLGFDGGKARLLLDDYILVKSFDYGLVEDAHGIINHLITDFLKHS